MTVLFAEVAAPAGLAGTLGLEALRDLVGGSLATVIAEVEALGGTVISVSGRGLQAMFGAPEAHEDDPERAVRAAYRAISATAAKRRDSTGAPQGRLPRARPEALGLRIGIESGPALVGPIGGGAKVEYAALRRRGQRRRGAASPPPDPDLSSSARRPGPRPRTCSAGARAKG